MEIFNSGLEFSGLDALGQVATLQLKLSLLLLTCFFILKLWRGSAANRHLLMTLALSAGFALPLASVLLPSIPLIFEISATNNLRLPIAPPNFVTQVVAKPGLTVDDFITIVGLVYLSVSGLLLFKIVLGNYLAWHLVKHAQPVDQPTWCQLLANAKSQLGLKRPIKLRVSDKIRSPMTWGLFRPVILIPADAITWQDRDITSTLLHELAHIRRGDWITQQWSQCICAVYWPNPLCWLSFHILATNAEAACDDVAINAGVKSSQYAKVLLRIAQLNTQASQPYANAIHTAAVNMARAYKRSQLGQRITALLNNSAVHTPNTHGRIAITVVAIATLLLPLASLRAGYVLITQHAGPILNSIASENQTEIPLTGDADENSTAIALYEPLTRSEFKQLTLVDIRRSLNQLSLSNLGLGSSKPKPVEGEPKSPPSQHGKTPAQVSTELHVVNSESKKNEHEQTLTDVQITHQPEPVATATTKQLVNENPWHRLIAMQAQAREASSHENNKVELAQLSRQRLVLPIYPRRAQAKGIEGEVTVRYSIDRSGAVYAVNIVNAQPAGIFESNVVKAVQQFQFQPHQVDGTVTAVEDVEEKFVFVLEG